MEEVRAGSVPPKIDKVQSRWIHQALVFKTPDHASLAWFSEMLQIPSDEEGQRRLSRCPSLLPSPPPQLERIKWWAQPGRRGGPPLRLSDCH